jgi:hypothetical protein
MVKMKNPHCQGWGSEVCPHNKAKAHPKARR